MNKSHDPNTPEGGNIIPTNPNVGTNYSVERVLRTTRKHWYEVRRTSLEMKKMTGKKIIQALIDNARGLTGTNIPAFTYSRSVQDMEGVEGKNSGIQLLGSAIENYFGGRSPRTTKDKKIITNFLNKTPFEGILDMDYGPAIRLVGSKISVEKFYESMKGIQASYAFLAILAGIQKTAEAKRYVGGIGDINTERLNRLVTDISMRDGISIGNVISIAAHYAQSDKAPNGSSIDSREVTNNSSSDTVTPHPPQ